MDLLVQTGFRRAVVSLTLDDVQKVSSALIDFHCMLKVKAAMDQFKNGLKTLGLLNMLEENPSLWKPLFVSSSTPLNTGENDLYWMDLDTLHLLFI